MELIIGEKNYNQWLGARFVSGNFLQSSIWRDFLRAQDKNFWQIALERSGQTVGVCLFYENKLPGGRSYLYSPKGPLLSPELTGEERQEALSLILSRIREVTAETKKYKEIFYKLEPENRSDIFPEFIKATDVQPRSTWVLDLQADYKEMLAAMHPKTRYNIALARKHGVKIRFSQTAEDLEHFLPLIKKTAQRTKIQVHPEKYYRLLYQTLLQQRAGELCLAELDHKVIAANLILRFGLAVTYIHGGSDYNYREAMAPHLLQWETIKQSQELGYKYYDFWGVAPNDGSKPRWEGISRFKKGFGGRLLESPGAYNFVYDQNWYTGYRLANYLRRLLP